MSRFNFQSPGAAFTEQIAQSLAQRKAEERQNLLDQLTVNAEGRAQQAAERQAAESKSQLAGEAQQQELARVEALGAGMDMDSPISDLSPEDQALMKKWYRARRLPTPSVSSSTEFSAPEGLTMDQDGATMSTPPAPAALAPEKYGFVGTGKERDTQRQRNMSAQIIAGLYNSKDPKAGDLAKLAEQVALANDGVLPGDFITKFMSPDMPVSVYDVDSGKINQGGTVPAYGQLVTRTRPPREYRPRNLMAFEDADGNAVLVDQETLPIDPATGVAKVPNGLRPASRSSGGAGGNVALGISNGAYNSYIEELTLGEPDANGKLDAGTMLGIRTRAAKIISEAKTTPKIKELARQFVSDPDSIANEDVTEKESLQLRQLLNVLAADPSVANLYRQNAVRRSTVKTSAATPTPMPAATGWNPSDAVLGRIK